MQSVHAMHEEPASFTHYGYPGMQFSAPTHDKSVTEGLSREAGERDLAMLKALNAPWEQAAQQTPPLKAPALPDDFAQRIEQLDSKIMSRGIAVDRDKLQSLGEHKFAQLLELDRKAPRDSVGSALDLTSFDSVQRALSAFEALSVAPRKMREQLSGDGKEREQARKITGFDDLFKLTSERRETIDDIYAFRDLFESLIFGQSMIERIERDGRVRSRFFCAGKGRKIELLRDWLSVVQGEHVIVTLKQPLWHVVSSLANERTAAPSYIDLARDWFSVRSPSSKQIKIAYAVFEGFLFGYRDWPLWQHVGTRTRTMIDESRLSAWRKELAARYLRITGFHEQLRLGSGAHRTFVDSTLQQLFDRVSEVLALAIETAFPRSVVARFQSSILCEGKPKQRAEITAHLAKAFPSSAFELEFAEVRS